MHTNCIGFWLGVVLGLCDFLFLLCLMQLVLTWALLLKSGFSILEFSVQGFRVEKVSD